MAQLVKNLPAVQETWVWSLGWEDPLARGMITHCSILALRIPRTQVPGQLQFMGSQKVQANWATNTHTWYILNKRISCFPSNILLQDVTISRSFFVFHDLDTFEKYNGFHSDVWTWWCLSNILLIIYWGLDFPGSWNGKESTCNTGDLGLIPGLGRSPGRGHGNPFQYSCLENPHGQRCLAGYSPWGCKESDTTEQLSTSTNKSKKT